MREINLWVHVVGILRRGLTFDFIVYRETTMLIALLVVLTVLLGVPYASVFEWTLHRYVMHRPVGRFRYAFNAHALTHHGLFGADETYHLRPSNVREKIPMAWWNGPVLILISSAPFYVIAMLMYFVFGLEGALSVAVTALILFSSYSAYMNTFIGAGIDLKIEGLNI